MSFATSYTTTLPSLEMSAFRTMPGNLFFEEELEETEIISPSANVWSRLLLDYPMIIAPFETYREGFIGMLTDEEAREMKEGVSLFKKRFDDDLARRHKILFGE